MDKETWKTKTPNGYYFDVRKKGWWKGGGYEIYKKPQQKIIVPQIISSWWCKNGQGNSTIVEAWVLQRYIINITSQEVV